MFSIIQIFLCLSALYCATCTPIFGEFRLKKNFEVEHKPIPFPHFKPVELIKEFVTPFGMFGMKHAIGKRDLDNIKTVDAEPERVSLMPPPLEANRYEVVEAGGSGQLPYTPVPPVMGAITPGMGPVVDGRPVPSAMAPHFVEIKPIPAPPPPPVVITPPPPRAEQGPPKGFHTDIAREEAISEYIRQVERDQVYPVDNQIEPKVEEQDPKVEEPPKQAPPKVEQPPNPIVRGSRLAIYFGNMLIDVLTQLLGGGRIAELINRPLAI